MSCHGATGKRPLQHFILYKTRDHAESHDGKIYGHSRGSFLDPCAARKEYHIMNIPHHASSLVHVPFCQASHSSARTLPPTASLLQQQAGCRLRGFCMLHSETVCRPSIQWWLSPCVKFPSCVGSEMAVQANPHSPDTGGLGARKLSREVWVSDWRLPSCTCFSYISSPLLDCCKSFFLKLMTITTITIWQYLPYSH